METTTHLTPMPQDSAGTQPLRRLAVFLGLAALLLLSVGAAFVAHAAVSPRTSTANHALCRATQVTLHGNEAPTVSCRDGLKLTGRTLTVGSGPFAHLVGIDNWCDDDALVLYWNSPVGSTSGPWLCINGAGVLNLNQSFNGYYWNDQASAFWTGCYSDFFFVDINRGGNSAYASGSYNGENSPSNTFPYQGVGNDQLSSVWQYAKSGGDDCW